MKSTGRWSNISGAAHPYLYLLVDKEQNVIPAKASDIQTLGAPCASALEPRVNILKRTYLCQRNPMELLEAQLHLTLVLPFLSISDFSLAIRCAFASSQSFPSAMASKPLPLRRSPAWPSQMGPWAWTSKRQSRKTDKTFVDRLIAWPYFKKYRPKYPRCVVCFGALFRLNVYQYSTFYIHVYEKL